MTGPELLGLLQRATERRAPFRDPEHRAAYRLFNGFTEGAPDFAIDLYGRTLVVHDHREPGGDDAPLAALEGFTRAELPDVRALLVKTRRAEDEAARRGVLRFGDALDRKVREHGVWYALDLTLNRDASLYLDTRGVRRWLLDHAAGKKVLNTFAYTGSLGVAARAAGAQVVQTDLNRAFLNLAKTSYALNGWPVARADFRSGDFFEKVSELKRQGALFDVVVVDPPFFSATEKGTVDLEGEAARLLNKVRPLVGDGGVLVAINNALFVSGEAYTQQLERLGEGYLELETRIDVPDDFATPGATWPMSPEPFNHPTKIAVLRAKRKDGRRA